MQGTLPLNRPCRGMTVCMGVRALQCASHYYASRRRRVCCHGIGSAGVRPRSSRAADETWATTKQMLEAVQTPHPHGP